MKQLSQEKGQLEQLRATIQHLEVERASLRHQIDQLETRVRQHPASTSAEIERRDREIERLRQVLDRIVGSLLLNQKSMLTEIPKRDQRIGELEFEVTQLSSSAALRLAKRIPFGGSVRKLLLCLGVSEI